MDSIRVGLCSDPVQHLARLFLVPFEVSGHSWFGSFVSAFMGSNLARVSIDFLCGWDNSLILLFKRNHGINQRHLCGPPCATVEIP